MNRELFERVRAEIRESGIPDTPEFKDPLVYVPRLFELSYGGRSERTEKLKLFRNKVAKMIEAIENINGHQMSFDLGEPALASKQGVLNLDDLIKNIEMARCMFNSMCLSLNKTSSETDVSIMIRIEKLLSELKNRLSVIRDEVFQTQ